LAYRVASFNIKNYAGNNKDKIRAIANVIRYEDFDIVAIQEIKSQGVRNAGALYSLLMELPGYKGCFGDNPSSGAQGDYGFAFLYNADKFKECSEDGEAEIFSRFNNFVRCPYFGRFTPIGTVGGLFTELRLLNIHLNPSQTVSSTSEFKLLHREVFNYISDRIYKHKTFNMDGSVSVHTPPSYTIVLGDYNFILDDCNRMLAEMPQKKNVTVIQKEETTIWPSNERTNVPGHFVRDYDHVSFDSQRFVGISTEIHRVNTVQCYYGGDFDTHFKELSDHVPIVFQIELNPRKERL
jgi:endonuclease/exonuclease/phosphatase family metal-dependent hydrolase